MQLSLPLLQSSTWSSSGVSYNTAVDASYEIYNINLGLFNVPNAFTDGADTSQGKRGILWVGPRHSQNQAWNSQYWVYVAAGASALSVKALTYDFNRSIKSIDSGNVRGWLYTNWLPTVTFDITNKEFDVVSVNWNNTIIDYWKKWYVWISWWQKFIISGSDHTSGPSAWSSIYLCSANNEIIWLATAVISWEILCVVWQYAWTRKCSWNDSFNFRVILYSISNTWIPTVVQSAIITWMPQNFWFSIVVSSYLENNICHIIASSSWALANPSFNKSTYIRVDTSITGSVSSTIVNNINWSVFFGTPNTWWLIYNLTSAWVDWWNIIFVANDNNLRKWDATWFSNLWPSFVSYWIPVAYWNWQNRFLTNNNNISLINWWVNILWLISTWIRSNWWVFLTQCTWSNNEDSWFIWARFNEICLWKNIWLSLVINWSTIINYNRHFWLINQIMNILNFTSTTTQLSIEFICTNTWWIPIKLWFGLTWWTYASPTGTNGTFWWDATNGSTLTGTPSLLSLTIQ